MSNEWSTLIYHAFPLFFLFQSSMLHYFLLFHLVLCYCVFLITSMFSTVIFRATFFLFLLFCCFFSLCRALLRIRSASECLVNPCLYSSCSFVNKELLESSYMSQCVFNGVDQPASPGSTVCDGIGVLVIYNKLSMYKPERRFIPFPAIPGVRF